MQTIELPFPPSVNNYWRTFQGRMLISKPGREYRKTVCDLMGLIRVNKLAGPVAVKVELHPPDNRRRDIDNSAKALLDALQHGGAYEDDSQIVELWIQRRENVKGGKAVVKLTSAI